MTVAPPDGRDWIARRALPFSIAACAILWIGPYWSWPTPGYFRFSVVAVIVAFGASMATRCRTFSLRDILLALLLLALMLYYASHTGRGGPFEISYGWVALVFFMLVDDDTKRRAFHDFAIMFALTLVPGMVVFVFSAVGIELPWHTLYAARFDFEVLRGNDPGYYREYLGSVVRNDQVYSVGPGSVFRLHGMWDEPGTVGTFSGLLLVAGGMQLKGKLHNVILLIGGILSFSLAFYTILFLYFLGRRPLATLAASGGVAALVLSSKALSTLPIVDLFFLSRFTLNKGGGLAADNRVTGVFAALYRDFWNADLWTRLFGSTNNVALLVNTGTFSYEVVVFTYGVVGMTLLVAFLVAATTSISMRRQALILLVIFLVSIYQRPNVLTMPYLVLLMGGAVHLAREARRSADSGLFAPAAAAS